MALERTAQRLDHPGHAKHHQREQDHGRDHRRGRRQQVAADDLEDADAGREQRGGGQQREALAGDRDLALANRRRDVDHRRVQGGRAAADVGDQPPEVDDAPRVVGLVEQPEGVEGVRGHQPEQADQDQVVGRRPHAGAEHQSRRRPQQHQVQQRVGDRDRQLQPPDVRRVRVRDDQVDPRDQADTRDDDHGVDQARAVLGPVATADEEDQRRGHDRIGREVGDVGGPGERRGDVEDLLVEGADHVADDEAQLAQGQQVPGPPEGRLVADHADDHGDDRRQSDHVIDRMERDVRNDVVGGAEGQPAQRVDLPDARAHFCSFSIATRTVRMVGSLSPRTVPPCSSVRAM